MGAAEHTISTLRIEIFHMHTELDDLRRQAKDMVPRSDLEGAEHTIAGLRDEINKLQTEIRRLQAEQDATRRRLQEVRRECA